ncbi:adenine-specific DNA-methyltransferase [Chryseobacterium ginsenosidimutans]|uniref:DNA methyltransferase n=1 Tax=Chryseobacterium ginsenosidimutans TaxID=687846 RepID=UPI0021686CC9|nr:site-specific DNA-methyltransferase [Chryseobacterium ginsenosidimutans]MCS3868915.1 adenine-specific DNA-methyltransferase [Chryseobacterium ginsenosidimutans]
MKLYQTLETQLKKEPNYVSDNNELKKWVVLNKAQNFDEELIELLLDDSDLKEKFFIKVKDTLIFKQNLFIQFLEQKNYLNDSYTQFKNKVGLSIDGKYLKQRNEVALVWPFKDCVLEGGQSREEDKREEIFFNETLAQDEITELLDPKVFTNAKLFDKDGEKSFNQFNRNENGTITDNLIIKGNNLLALHSLRKEFAGKVKLIYIDPPYNTGNDGFKYNDSFNHSTWLTFMRNRLSIAKELLSKDGVIFVQCDDNEQAYLKILMDEIFKRENFISSVVWQRSYSPINLKKHFSDNHDTIHCYTKKLKCLNNFTISRNEKATERYKNPDNDPRGSWMSSDISVGPPIEKNIYPIINTKGESIYPPKGRSWSFSKERMEELLKDNRIYFPISGNSVPRFKRFLTDVKNGIVPMSLWTYQEVGHTQDAKREIKDLFDGEVAFESPKPEKLMHRFIEIATSEGEIVLDFHLGSGTTATTAHKMNRQYIGIEQMNYIETVSVERLKKVIDGEQGGISKSVNWQGGGSFIYFELKKYNQTFIEKIEEAQDSENLLKIWEEMKTKSFLNYNVDIKKQEQHFEDFKALHLKEQKQHLCELLNKNQLYVNLSSLNDKNFECTSEEKKVTKDFYQIKK